jgi:hypothetical protein
LVASLLFYAWGEQGMAADNLAFVEAPELGPFRDWLHAKGRQTYFKFLLTHPSVFAGEPLAEVDILLLGIQSYYYARGGFVATPYGLARPLIYPHRWPVLFLALVALVACLWCLRIGTNELAMLGGLLILLVYPHAVVVWHGDAMEVARHSVSNAVQLRLGIWLAILAATDLLLRHHRALPAQPDRVQPAARESIGSETHRLPKERSL